MTSQTKDAAFNAKLGRMKKAELIDLAKNQKRQIETFRAYQGDMKNETVKANAQRRNLNKECEGWKKSADIAIAATRAARFKCLAWKVFSVVLIVTIIFLLWFL